MRKKNLQNFDASQDHTYLGDNPLVASLVPEEARTVLDIGCGSGGTAARLSSGGKITVDGVTWSASEATDAKKTCRNVYLADVSTGLSAVTTDGYDCIICSHLLEHIAYPQSLLNDIHRKLRAGGCLIVAIPNLFFWRDRLRLMAGEWKYESSGTFDYTHLRWYTVDSMKETVEPFGFAQERFIADGWIPLPGLRHFMPSRTRKKVNDVVASWFPGLFGKQLVYRFLRV